MLHYCNLEKIVFESNKECNEIIVISGYLGPEMVKKLSSLKKKDKLIVVYGMYGENSISCSLHNKLIELDNSSDKLEIYYSKIPVHSKLYCWIKDGQKKEVLIGSANFSASGLRNDYRECLHEIPKESFDQYEEYKSFILSHCIRCTNETAKYRTSPKCDIHCQEEQPYIDKGICRMTLLDENGSVPSRSGLNWGYQSGHATKSKTEAYIGIKAEYRSLFPELFPNKTYVNGTNSPTAIGKKLKQNDDIDMLWDDGTSMIGLMEGSHKRKDDIVTPLQISSSRNKTILGKYLRYRIVEALIKKNYQGATDLKKKLDNGESFEIKKKMLEEYGRTHIDISIVDGIYFLDFSV